LFVILHGVHSGYADMSHGYMLSEKDTDGLKLNFGNADAMVEMISRIAYRQRFGDLLAEGSLTAGKTLGPAVEDRVMHCLGQELPGYEPRRSPATGFSLSSSNRGADHLRADRIMR